MKRRFDGSFLISIVLHIVLGAGLLYVLSMPYPLQQWLHQQHHEAMPTEHIGFVRLPDNGVTTPGKSGGDGHPVPHNKVAPPLTAPPAVPKAIPPAAKTATPEQGTGPIVGNGGPTAGIVPSYHDPRIWSPPSDEVVGPLKSPSERLDSALAQRVKQHNDSLATLLANAGRAPGDWTVDKNGKKWGIDQSKIYLGSFSIPSAILALLPIKGGNNPILEERGRMQLQQHAEIFENADRAMNEDDFHDAVKRIRQRKEKEHEEEVSKHKKEMPQPAPIPDPQPDPAIVP